MDDDLLDVARTIRPYLPSLIGEAAPEVDREIADLLGQAASGLDVDDRIGSLLSRSPPLRDWAAQVLEDELHRPPELQRKTVRAYNPLPGQGNPVGAQRYVCPVDRNYVWWRRSVGVPIPACPDHHVTLVQG